MLLDKRLTTQTISINFHITGKDGYYKKDYNSPCKPCSELKYCRPGAC